MVPIRLVARKPMLLQLLTGVLIVTAWDPGVRAEGFLVTNLVTDDQKANPAKITDGLVNAWGISYGATSPFWVSSNGTGVSQLYSVNPSNDVITKVPVTVVIPGDGSVTGQVFNGTSAFNNDRFLFVNEDGTISGWRGALGTDAERFQVASDAVYKGVALATIGANTYLYAANFHSGAIDVLKGTPGAPNLTGSFTDPNLPGGYAPFNIQLLGDKLYVTYAMVGSGKDEKDGPGLGIVNAFDTQGNLINRVASPGGPLNAPWGLAIAPNSFGAFAGDLLVGNFGDGTINAFNLSSKSFDGPLLGLDGKPLVIDGLWGLIPGNGGAGGSTERIYFSAGPDDESHGLFGSISSIPEPSTVLLGLIAIVWLTAAIQWRAHRAARAV